LIVSCKGEGEEEGIVRWERILENEVGCTADWVVVRRKFEEGRG
jgi:hypothetical protein